MKMLYCNPNQTIRIWESYICTALEHATIGSKVFDYHHFFNHLYNAIQAFVFDACAVKGQGNLSLHPDVCQYVSCGVGKRTENVNDYVLRLYRGKVSAFLRRELAATTAKVNAIVYTAEAYLESPGLPAEEAEKFLRANATHALVAVLASNDVPSPLSPHRLVSNLAGGNAEALTWDANTIRELAKSSIAYYDEWETVAD